MKVALGYDLLDDHELIDGILNNDKPLIKYFFTEKCSGLFAYILINVFDECIDKRELVSEFYIFMARDDWQVLRRFQYRSSLMTYISVVAVRFFQRKRLSLIDSQSSTPLNEWMAQKQSVSISLDQRLDIRMALQKMPNARYRKVIEVLDLQDVRPELLADEMNVTVENLYNIHRRALVQLRLVMGRKEDYV